MKTVYDDPNFARRIHKYKGCRSNITLFKRILLSHWSVFEKVTVKIKKIGKIGKSNTQKRRKKKGDIEDERAEKGFLDSNDSNDLTKDKTIGNDGVIVIDSNSKSIDAELLEGEFNTEMIPDESIDAEGNKELLDGEFNTEMIPDESIDAEVNVTGGMEVVEAGDAEGNAVKDLLKGESNVSEQEDKPTTDDTEILDKGGGRKGKTVRMGEGDYLFSNL